ncbi:preprotein translocase subunit SecD [Duganella sp. CF402]|uniref:protein translocase subunit SecD n=1 Tax=unclassified Duganella TaxID=2636909 RepID=UPI0008CF1C36|nr:MULTISPECIES: protein translocase subunit SecD [unclassified Duganella]RZT10852.1 preprotein translocase subunit SecD [Duganella sp. BK701]SEK93648.1 preprotein translocase subunit SecD [Duganella sp. CF402]
MNRYPIWKYVLIAVAIVLGALYAAPNYFGEVPTVQVISGKSNVKITHEIRTQVADVLAKGGIEYKELSYDNTCAYPIISASFASPDIQFRAKSVLDRGLNSDLNDPAYIVALNLQADTPKWLQALRAVPMYLGLDLRGGVHFLMQVDTKAVLNKRIQGIQASTRSILRDKDVRHAGVAREGDTIEIKFREDANRQRAKEVLAGQLSGMAFTETGEGNDLKITMRLKPEALKQIIADGLQQNINTLAKRVNQLGVAEPVIQQQGIDRIVVQLPGMQDVARARSVIGRTASLEIRMVDDAITPGSELSATIPFNDELLTGGKGAPVVVNKDVILTGDYITSAIAAFDQNQRPAVNVDLNSEGRRRISEATTGKVGKHMAIVLYEKADKPEVLSVPMIQQELNGSGFNITGMATSDNAAELALLLRSGALSAPMEVIEERTIGPALGAENIAKGIHSTMYGFAAIAVFMIAYYMIFGFFSVFALACNLLFLLAILSQMQVTLTLPGMAAIALALGMAIDSNVLINERIREELRAGATPQAAITAGFDRAWATIIDSNVTTLIVGVALWVFGSGPIRGFAVVHTLGILTSMFSAVFVSRGVVNLWYGRKKKLQSIAIGTVWVPGQK